MNKVRFLKYIWLFFNIMHEIIKSAKINDFLRNNLQNYQFKTHPTVKTKIPIFSKNQSLSAQLFTLENADYESGTVLELNLNNAS